MKDAKISRVTRRSEGRVQYLSFTIAGALVRAMRYFITDDRTCPWLVATGADKLPQNAIARGQFLTSIFNA